MFQRGMWWYQSRLKIPIRWKLMIAIIGFVLFFGSIHVWVMHQLVYSTVEGEYIKNGILNARMLASKLEEAVLFEDRVSIEEWLWQWKGLSRDHGYALVVSPDSAALASTFPLGLPVNLRTTNFGQSDKPRIVRIFDSSTPMIDVAIPLVNGAAGWLRLGFFEQPVLTPLVRLLRIQLGMVGLFVLLGVLGSILFSHLFTTPIGELVAKTSTVDLNGPPVEFNLHTGDEWERLAGSFSAMTERLQQSHRQYLDAYHRAGEAQKLAALGLMASGIAHEIMNPVAGVENALKRIEKTPENIEQIRRYLPTMKESIDHVQAIVGQMLTFARPETVSPAIHELRALIDHSLVLVSHRLNESNIRFVRNTGEELVKVSVDAQAVVQVFVNLFLNAIDAMPEGGMLSVRVTQANSRATIAIADTGIGIPAENLERIWEPFYTTKSIGKGMGLGLSVTRSLVERCGGIIRVRSEEGIGTTFTVELPVAT